MFVSVCEEVKEVVFLSWGFFSFNIFNGYGEERFLLRGIV